MRTKPHSLRTKPHSLRTKPHSLRTKPHSRWFPRQLSRRVEKLLPTTLESGASQKAQEEAAKAAVAPGGMPETEAWVRVKVEGEGEGECEVKDVLDEGDTANEASLGRRIFSYKKALVILTASSS